MTTSTQTRPAGLRNGIPVKFYTWHGTPPKPRPKPPPPPKPPRAKPRRNPNTAKTHCPSNHAYDDANTYRTPAGYRHCRACQRERALRESRARSLRKTGIDLADPCLAVVIEAVNNLRPQTALARADIAALAVRALRESGLLPPKGAAQ